MHVIQIKTDQIQLQRLEENSLNSKIHPIYKRLIEFAWKQMWKKNMKWFLAKKNLSSYYTKIDQSDGAFDIISLDLDVSRISKV